MVLDDAVKLANTQMQAEILPRLTTIHPQPTLWNPLVAAKGPGYAMKLRLPDVLVMEILRNDNILDQVAEIVVDSVSKAALDDPQGFVSEIFESLMRD